MKHYRIFLALAVLVLASLACQTLIGGGNDTQNPPAVSNANDNEVNSVEPTEPTTPSDSNENTDTDVVVSTDFPMTDDAFNVTEVGDGSLLYYTNMSQEDVMDFYREEYSSRGYQEREILTVVSEGVFSMVFDGDPSGKAVVIQSVDLGDGSCTVAIRLEDV